MEWSAFYPGQGSQQVGMGRYLFDNFKSVKALFEQASDILKTDFKKLCFEGPETDLALTQNTQPALLLVSHASETVLKEVTGFSPDCAAGHSVGEYAALVGAGALSFEAALASVRSRGQAMQSAVPLGQGGMLAVMGLDAEQIKKLCEWTQQKSGLGPVEPANYNAPGQIVLSGNKKALDWLVENFETEVVFSPAPKRVRLIPLKVSAPFHCSLMKPAEEKMAEVLNSLEWQNASLPVVQNYVAEGVSDKNSLRQNLIAQVSGPVRWIESLEWMTRKGIEAGVELGHGKVISGLVKKTCGDDLTMHSMNSLDELKNLEKELGAK